MTPTRCAEMLLKKITRQIECYDLLQKMSAEQSQVVEASRYDLLPKINGKRDEVLAELKLSHRVTACYVNYWKKTAEQLSFPLRSQVENIFIQLTKSMETLAETDRCLRMKVTEAMSEMKTRIGHIGRGKVVASAYRKPQLQSVPRYISKVSQ